MSDDVTLKRRRHIILEEIKLHVFGEIFSEFYCYRNENSTIDNSALH